MKNLTPRLQQILALAAKEAIEANNNYICTEHVLLALIKLGQGVGFNILKKIGIDFNNIKKTLEKHIKNNSVDLQNNIHIPYTSKIKKIIGIASKEADNLKHSYIGSEHILLAILKEGDNISSKILKSFNIEVKMLRDEILSNLDPNNNNNTIEFIPLSSISFNNYEEEKNSFLNIYGSDLTYLAKKDKFDPVIGREETIERIIQILCRRTKNNPLLIGEAGVGKTAIVEGLSQKISSKEVPDVLLNKRIISLDLALLVSGTKYRGQFEEKIKLLMDEIKKSKDVILFIDEIHNLVGAGAAEGSMDASNIFKPELSRGEMQCIGATTMSEYKKYIERDSALNRRFQTITVNEPTIKDSINILRGIANKYEKYHNVSFTDKALITAVEYSDRYITDRFLPDKAIDIIDETASKVKIDFFNKNPNIDKIINDIEDLNLKQEIAIKNQEFEVAAELRDKIKILVDKKKNILEDLEKAKKNNKILVKSEDILKLVSSWIGLPLNQIKKEEKNKLLKFEDELNNKVIGQEQATKEIATVIRRSRANLRDPEKPTGSFLFLGPTGVGKTYLAEILAKIIFGKELIRLDMSEYMEKHTVSRLIGSPPGYIGYEEGGQLTESVRRNPYSLILFDEIEKAHPDILQILLQVLENGCLTDSLGQKIDFKNTIIIMTSNVGSNLIGKQNYIGFNSNQKNEDIRDILLLKYNNFFKPEFLNRINKIVLFNELDEKNILNIAEIEIKKLQDRLKNHNFKLNISNMSKKFIVEKAYNKRYGARSLKRAISEYLEEPLAEFLLKQKISKGKTINVELKNQKLFFK